MEWESAVAVLAQGLSFTDDRWTCAFVDCVSKVRGDETAIRSAAVLYCTPYSVCVQVPRYRSTVLVLLAARFQ